MAITINWLTKVISIPQADLIFVSGTLYEADTDAIRLELKSIEADEGIPFEDTHRHNTEVTVAGTTFARTIEIINGYSIEFTPDAQYSVRLAGSNNNFFDIENGILVQNQVQVIAQNSGGLIVTAGSGGVNPQDIVDIASAVWDEPLTGATHNLSSSSGRRLRQIQENLGYEGGFIFVDTLGGTAGTEIFENGTVENPVLTWADALTLNASLGLNSFKIGNGSVILLTTDSSGFNLVGNNWELQLGGQAINGTFVTGNNLITGTATGGGTPPRLIGCLLNDVTLPPFEAINCCFSGTVTATTSGNYQFIRCHSITTGVETAIFDYGTMSSNVDVTMVGWAQGIEIRNLNNSGTDTFIITGQGEIIYASSCSGTVYQRGDWEVTNTGGVTIVADDNTTNINSILEDTGATLPGAIADIPTDLLDTIL